MNILIGQIEGVVQKTRTQICIKCHKRGTFGERERNRDSIGDIIHGLPIIHIKDQQRAKERERKREKERGREKERERKREREEIERKGKEEREKDYFVSKHREYYRVVTRGNGHCKQFGVFNMIKWYLLFYVYRIVDIQ